MKRDLRALALRSGGRICAESPRYDVSQTTRLTRNRRMAMGDGRWARSVRR
ncbi:hypothetical protein AB3X82_00745 [Paraburkholderia phenoliruptrix]|uniref:hypothetical protein n=1 Tax=Paraburkholderia phenoliruptrix TaxID=252970 RepID=UPI002854A2EC|nr:hypothetical protein [Paraburkholderia phenoliruptrix]MDR6390325.1 hypothetical protein [Paraburkholderia phenoliruptrix]